MNENIPLELRERPQWVIWRQELNDKGKPTKVPYNPRTMMRASVTDPTAWSDFQTAVERSKVPGIDGVGFVLTADDPYCIIDLDDKPDSPLRDDERAVHEQILSTFDTYTERSHSGRGFHIVMRGAIPHGMRRDHVEIYSSERYMAFTGNVVRNAPIRDCQPILDRMVTQMTPVGRVNGADYKLDQFEGVLSDAEICEVASHAGNGAGERYVALCKGEWQELGYRSQSEADHALLSYLCFYTRDDAQVRRLFRYTALGKRDKATRNDDHINRSLVKLRSGQASPAELEIARSVAASLAQIQPSPPPVDIPPPPQEREAEPEPEPEPDWPPGLIGQIAQYFHATAPRPVAEIAITAAIGFCAGIAGRVYNVSDTGLNQYLLMIAKTGTGKEAMSSGIHRLVSAVRQQVPGVQDFIGPSAFASGQALIKCFDDKPGFFSILGEFGHTLQAMSDPSAAGPIQLIKRALLDIYGKSGASQILSSTAYSDVLKNTKDVQSPCLTIIGESTPESFFDSLQLSDIAQGLIPRFHIVEYTGERVPYNENQGCPPPQQLVELVCQFVAQCVTIRNNKTVANVPMDAAARVVLKAFNDECDAAMREARLGERDLWNRAHLKALKFAALFAVCWDWTRPSITVDMALRAINMVRVSTEAIVARLKGGDIGSGDDKRHADIRRMVREYFRMSERQLATYRATKTMQQEGCIPMRYFVARGIMLASFRQQRDRHGAARAVKEALGVLVETDQLGVLDQATARAKFGVTSQAVFYARELDRV